MAYEILSDKKKTQVTQLVNTADGLKLQQYYPETTAEVTNIKAIAGVTGTNVQQALESIQGNINDITGGGTVTNVNGVKGAVNIDEIKKILENGDYFVICDDKMQKEFGGISYQQKQYPLGEILAELAFEKLQTKACKWQELKPLYIQPPPMG